MEAFTQPGAVQPARGRPYPWPSAQGPVGAVAAEPVGRVAGVGEVVVTVAVVGLAAGSEPAVITVSPPSARSSGGSRRRGAARVPRHEWQ